MILQGLARPPGVFAPLNLFHFGSFLDTTPVFTPAARVVVGVM
jgi:hypothetical protein